MSSTTTQQKTVAAPWKKMFEDDIGTMDSPEFVLATLEPASGSGSGSGSVLPRARFCIYRGMWTELPPNKHNDLPRNPEGAFSSCLPTFTTDVRMRKVGQLFTTGPGAASDPSTQAVGSGGGGPVEAVWWAKEPMRQWRIKGDAWVMGPDIEADEGGKEGEGSSGVRSLKSEVGRRLELLDEGKSKDWSWRRELKAHFGNVSPGMRGSWKNPPPGTKVEHEPSPENKLGQKVGTDDELAWSNFRVVIIRPSEVERVDLSDPENNRRTLYKFEEEKEGDQGVGKWSEETLWP